MLWGRGLVTEDHKGLGSVLALLKYQTVWQVMINNHVHASQGLTLEGVQGVQLQSSIFEEGIDCTH